MALTSGKRQIRLTAEGAIYLIVLLAVLVGATTRQLNLLMLVGAMLAGPFFFSLLYGRLALARLSVKRKLPARLRTLERLSVDLQLANDHRWLRLWSVRVDDRVIRELPRVAEKSSGRAGVYFPTLGARQSGHAVYQGQLGARGRYELGPLRISTQFPLGLIRHTLVVAAYDTLLVHPPLGRLSRELAQVVRDSAAGSQRLRHGLLEADFYGLRDWRTGDSRRLIHWRTSARRGALVVRQFEQRRSQDLAVLVDLWSPAEPSAQELLAVERAISFAATLGAEACGHPGRQFTLHVSGESALDRAGPATAALARELLDALALVEQHRQGDLPDAVALALARVPPGVPAILITTRAIDVETVEAAAGANDLVVSGRPLRVINVLDPEITRFYQDP